MTGIDPADPHPPQDVVRAPLPLSGSHKVAFLRPPTAPTRAAFLFSCTQSGTLPDWYQGTFPPRSVLPMSLLCALADEAFNLTLPMFPACPIRRPKCVGLRGEADQ